MFDLASLRRTAVSSVGALVLATGATALATAPARATAFAPQAVSSWQVNVNRMIDGELRMPVMGMNGMRATSVTVRFDDAGKFADAAIARSSGIATVDAEALRTARQVSYPLLPAGAPRTVTMQLFFGPGSADAANQVGRTRLASR